MVSIDEELSVPQTVISTLSTSGFTPSLSIRWSKMIAQGMDRSIAGACCWRDLLWASSDRRPGGLTDYSPVMRKAAITLSLC